MSLGDVSPFFFCSVLYPEFFVLAFAPGFNRKWWRVGRDP